MEEETETIEGYVVDIACLRKYPLAKIRQRAKDHSKHCALMGRCIESGYGLVADDGQIVLLDANATHKVLSVLGDTSLDKGIRLRAVRQQKGDEVEVVKVTHL